jgi:hypothetical protein
MQAPSDALSLTNSFERWNVRNKAEYEALTTNEERKKHLAATDRLLAEITEGLDKIIKELID